MEDLEGIENRYPEEYIENYQAALCFASLKHEKINSETSLALQRLKTKIVFEIKTRRNKPKSPKDSNPNKGRSVFAQNLPRTPRLCPSVCSYFPPDIPPVPCLNGLIGSCSKPFEKQLTESDVKFNQCRLSISKFDVKNAVMPLLTKEDSFIEGIPVKVYDADGKEYNMTFKIWASKFHVLKNGWNDFRNDHSLIAHQDFVTLWAFRNLNQGNLCFVITSRRLQVFEAIKRRRLKQN